MRSLEDHNKIIELYKEGYNQSEISRTLRIPRATVRDIIKIFKQYNSPFKPNVSKEKTSAIINDLQNPTNEDKYIYQNYVYLLGVYLGDGSLIKIKNKKDLYRLRVTCDAKYPNLIQEIKTAIEIILPDNTVGSIKRYWKGKLSCIDVSCWSKFFIHLFPSYQQGRKHTYKIVLKPWQEILVNRYPKLFLRGLIQTDGCRYKQTNTKENYYYNFTQKSDDIKNMFLYFCNKLNIKYTCTLHKSGSKNIKGEDNTAWVITIRNKHSVLFMDTFIGPKN